MKNPLLIALWLGFAPALPAFAQQAETRTCLSPAETRAAVAENKLVEPLLTLRNAARAERSEPLASRLCRSGEDWVYEMTLLRRDGKVIHMFFNAADGKQVNSR